ERFWLAPHAHDLVFCLVLAGRDAFVGQVRDPAEFLLTIGLGFFEQPFELRETLAELALLAHLLVRRSPAAGRGALATLGAQRFDLGGAPPPCLVGRDGRVEGFDRVITTTS